MPPGDYVLAVWSEDAFWIFCQTGTGSGSVSYANVLSTAGFSTTASATGQTVVANWGSGNAANARIWVDGAVQSFASASVTDGSVTYADSSGFTHTISQPATMQALVDAINANTNGGKWSASIVTPGATDNASGLAQLTHLWLKSSTLIDCNNKTGQNNWSYPSKRTYGMWPRWSGARYGNQRRGDNRRPGNLYHLDAGTISALRPTMRLAGLRPS